MNGIQEKDWKIKRQSEVSQGLIHGQFFKKEGQDLEKLTQNPASKTKKAQDPEKDHNQFLEFCLGPQEI